MVLNNLIVHLSGDLVHVGICARVIAPITLFKNGYFSSQLVVNILLDIDVLDLVRNFHRCVVVQLLRIMWVLRRGACFRHMDTVVYFTRLILSLITC